MTMQGGFQVINGRWVWYRGFKSNDKCGSIWRRPRTTQEIRANAALESDFPEQKTRPRCRKRGLPTVYDDIMRPSVSRGRKRVRGRV